MEIRNINNTMLNKTKQQVSFTHKVDVVALNAALKVGDYKTAQRIAQNPDPSFLIKTAGKFFKWLAPKLEKKATEVTGGKKPWTVETLVNAGNCMKEAVCMIVYPLQVMTNPDLPKEKRRFVGLYDFFVTCFSLGGTLIYAKWGTPLTKTLVNKCMKNSLNNAKSFPIAHRAAEGAAFILGMAISNILFKRVIAPALSPPLAAKARKALEEKDARKEAANGQKPEVKKSSDTAVPAQYDAALSAVSKKDGTLEAKGIDSKPSNLLDAKGFKFTK